MSDKKRKGVRVDLGKLTLEPSHDKAREYEEETGDEYSERPKAKAPMSMLAKLGRFGTELAGAASKPWGRLMNGDEDDEK